MVKRLRRLIPDINFADGRVPDEKLAALVVTAEDFVVAQAATQPSALREIVTQPSHKRWSDVGGLDAIKQLLVEAVQWPARHGALYAAAGIQPPKGILFYGGPGTGKTLLAKALAGESGANFIAVKGPQMLSIWAGESERGVREVFRKARQTAPCIIFFDEIDTLTPNRGATGGSLTDRVVAQLLTEIDGVEDLRGVRVLAATNRLDQIDAACCAPGALIFSSSSTPPTTQAAAPFSMFTPGACRWHRASTSMRLPRQPRTWSAPRSRRCTGRPASPPFAHWSRAIRRRTWPRSR